MVPYTYDANDFKFYIAPGFASSMAYYEHIKNAFGVYISACYIHISTEIDKIQT